MEFMHRRSPIYVAYSFIRIPKLFVDLFVLPCVLSFSIVLIQLFLTSMVLGSLKIDQNIEKLSQTQKNNPLKRYLLNCDDCELRVCKFKGEKKLFGENCEGEFYDFVIYSKDPENFDVTPFYPYLRDNFKRIVICDDCPPSTDPTLNPSAIVLDTSKKTREIHVSSVWALLLYANGLQDPVSKVREYKDKKEKSKQTFGTLYIRIPGMGSIRAETLIEQLSVVTNLSSILVISVWLLVRAHRLILNYFSRSGVLLPLVSFLGPPFYSSIWILTLLRVGIFILPSILASYYVLNGEYGIRFMSAPNLIDWLLALFSGFLLAGLTSSISDLKGRKSVRYIIYRYVPLIIAFLGALLWLISILFPIPSMITFRNVILTTPLLGLVPLILSPILSPPKLMIALALATNLSCVYVLAKANRTWFDSHLEEI